VLSSFRGRGKFKRFLIVFSALMTIGIFTGGAALAAPLASPAASPAKTSMTVRVTSIGRQTRLG